MSSYVHACTSLEPEQQRLIESRFESWRSVKPHMQRIVTNIRELEHFLPAEKMRLILMTLLSSPDDPHLSQRSYQSICREHVCQGDKIRCHYQPQLVCRAVEMETFILWLYGKYRSTFQVEDNARFFLQKLLLGKPLTPTEKLFQMSEYAAWVTWSEESTPGPPIEAATSAIYIRASLGLDPELRYSQDPILLLVYSPPPDLLRPTIADAELYTQFEPPPKDFELYGLTRPLREDLPRRPEAIHSPTHFDRLLSTGKVAP